MSIANPYMHGPVETHNVGLRRKVTIASLSVAITLIIAKFIAYVLTDSVSIMTSLLDSSFDALASAVTMVSVMHAATPADEEHRFGHGKIEALAAMGQSLFIFSSACYLMFEASHRFFHPQPVRDAFIGMGVMVLSIVLTMLLLTFQRYVIRRAPSIAISADNLHYNGDLLMNIGVLCALGLSHFSPWPYYDPLFAGVVSFLLLGGAWRISRESYAILMDQELSDVRTRTSGHRVFIEFHLELDGNLSLKKAHDVTEELEAVIYKDFPKSEVLIHPEPAGLDDHRIDDRIKG